MNIEIPTSTRQSTITVGEIIDMTDKPVKTKQGMAFLTKVVTDTGDILPFWRDESSPELPALAGKKIGDEVGVALDISFTPDLANSGKMIRKVYGNPIVLERARAFLANEEADYLNEENASE